MLLKDWLERGGLGSRRRLARALGAPAADVSFWALGSRPTPAHWCVAIERVSAGEVTAEELRPDLNWVRVAEDGWPHGKPVLDVEQQAA